MTDTHAIDQNKPLTATEPAGATPEPFKPEPRYRPLYQAMACACDARLHCAADIATLTKIPGMQAGSTLPLRQEWFERWTERLEDWTSEYFPSGSGFDSGTKFDLDASNGEKLIFRTSFHHMNEGGFYDGWTDHTVTIRPSLLFGYVLTISGRNRNQIKEYIADCFRNALDSIVTD